MIRDVVVGAGLLAFLAAPLCAQTRPVTLTGAPGRWTIGGQAVSDGDLGVRLRVLYETRRDKRLYFATARGVSYGQAVEAIGVAFAAGVEQLALLPEDGSTQNALVVSELVALPGLDADLRLPITDGYTTDRPEPRLELTLRRSGVEPEGLAGASGAARVLLRADARSSYGDVLRALRQLKARGALTLSLAVEKPGGPGELRRRCEAGQASECGALGELYAFGLGGAPKDPATGVSLMRRACGGGERRSCEMLALVLWEGEVVARNREEAAKLLRDNCSAGVKTSCAMLQSAGLQAP